MWRSRLASGDPHEEARGRGSAAGLGARGEGPRQERSVRGAREDPEPRGSLRDGQGLLLQPQGRSDRPWGLGAGVLPAAPVAGEARGGQDSSLRGEGALMGTGGGGWVLWPEAGPGAPSPWKPLSCCGWWSEAPCAVNVN